MNRSQLVYRSHERVETVLFPPEAVIFDERSSQVHYLNASATQIWVSLMAGSSAIAVAETIALQHQLSMGDVTAEVNSTIAVFEARGLLVSGEQD